MIIKKLTQHTMTKDKPIKVKCNYWKSLIKKLKSQS